MYKLPQSISGIIQNRHTRTVKENMDIEGICKQGQSLLKMFFSSLLKPAITVTCL